MWSNDESEVYMWNDVEMGMELEFRGFFFFIGRKCRRVLRLMMMINI